MAGPSSGWPASNAIVRYLFHRIGRRLDGRPTLILIDEGWLALDDPIFGRQLKEWLKTLRKKNASVVFATQSLADIEGSSIAPAIIESCPTRLFLANERALERQIAGIYRRFGLNERQIEIIASATPKRDHYCQSAAGSRLFDLGLGPVALAFTAASSRTDMQAIAALHDAHGPDGFAAAWLRHRGLDWAADLLPPSFQPQTMEMIANAETRWHDAVGGFQDSLRTQATIVTNLDDTRAQVGTLVGASQTATGALQAAQAGNQLIALQTRQLADLTALIAAQSRAASLDAARTTADEAQGREQTKRFLAAGSAYVARSVSLFHDYARGSDPFATLADTQVSIDVKNVVRASADSFRIAWDERRYDHGQLSGTTHWSAILTVVVRTPTDAATLSRNPLGLYVHAINWSQDLGE
jgi:type IV secretory pathway TrbF-like protein